MPFLPKAEVIWGPAPGWVYEAWSLPNIFTRLCSGAQSPLSAKPNTNASFTAASATCGSLLKTSLQGQNEEALVATSCLYCLETRDSDASQPFSHLCRPRGMKLNSAAG